MSKAADIPNENAYSSTVRKVLNVKSDGTAIDTFSVNLDTLTIDNVNITDYHTDSEDVKDTITNVSSNIAFTQDVEEIIILNTSDEDIIYMNLDGGTATTDNQEVYGKEKIVVNKKVLIADGISFISSNAAGTVVKMTGLYSVVV